MCVPGVWSIGCHRLFHGGSKPKRKVEPRSACHVQCHGQGGIGRPANQNICQEWHYHSCRMCDCMEPECARHLFFSDVGARHMDNHFPMQLDKSIGQLALCRSSNYFGLAINEILTDGQTKELKNTVQVEAVCQWPSCSLEKAKRRDDILGRERL